MDERQAPGSSSGGRAHNPLDTAIPDEPLDHTIQMKTAKAYDMARLGYWPR